MTTGFKVLADGLSWIAKTAAENIDFALDWSARLLEGESIASSLWTLPTGITAGLALGMAVLVCVARVYVGAHYPGDVLAGAAIGAGVAWLAYRPLAPAGARIVSVTDAALGRLRIPPRDRIARA